MATIKTITDLVHVINSAGSSSFEILSINLKTGEMRAALPQTTCIYAQERLVALFDCIPEEERPFCARAIVSRVIAISPLDDGPQVTIEHTITEESVTLSATGINPADNRYLMITLPHSGATGYHSFGAMLEGIVTAEPDAIPGPQLSGYAADSRIQRDNVVAKDWIPAGKLVAVDRETGRLVIADSTNRDKMPAIGIAVANMNGQVNIQGFGFVQQLSGLSPGKMHFVGPNGTIVDGITSEIAVMQPIGIALSYSVLSLAIGSTTQMYGVSTMALKA